MNENLIPGCQCAPYDVAAVRRDFPILERRVHDQPLIYLDNAASPQKPLAVINAMSDFYRHGYANIHRGVHTLSQEATVACDAVRTKVRRFLNAAADEEIIFVRGTTEGINLVAQTYGRQHVGSGDEIIISALEHHSNIVPWQMLCEEKGARLRVIPMTDDGELILEDYARLFTDRTRLVAVVHVSNALGTVNPVQQMIALAHEHGVPVLVDGAQAVPHLAVDVQALGCDFYVFSGHKLYGPTGIGVCYGRRALLEAMPPWQGGGSMIRSVTFEKTLYAEPPYKFEAGTPAIAEIIGLGAALDYVNGLCLGRIAAHEGDLLAHGTALLGAIPGVRLVGRARARAGILSFVLDHVHPHDVGTVLDLEGIAIRAGHHCAQPVMHRLGLEATARASLALYNTREELERLAAVLPRIREFFA